MDSLFASLFSICSIIFIVGIVKPSLVIRWGDENKTRGQVIKYYGVAMVVFLVLFSIVHEEKIINCIIKCTR